MKALDWITHRQVLSALCAAPLLFSSAFASAEDAAPAVAAAVTPDYTLTYNMGLYTNYIARGNNYSTGPSLQAGIDWAHSSGFYLGTLWTTVDPNAFGAATSVFPTDTYGVPLGKGARVQSEFYAGYAHTFENGIGINVLGDYIAYLEGEKSYDNHKQDSFEVDGSVSYKWFTYTYAQLLTNYYGLNNPATGKLDTRNANYNELKFNYKLPVGDLNFMAKVGYWNLKNLAGDQADYAIGLNRDFSMPTMGKPLTGFNAGAVYTGTFSREAGANVFYTTDMLARMNQNYLTFYIKRTW